MSHLFRDVLLPSSVAICLLLAEGLSQAKAGDEPTGSEPVGSELTVAAAAAVKPEPGEFEVRMPRTSPARESAAASTASEPDGRRCRRVERIGKTSARVCP